MPGHLNRSREERGAILPLAAAGLLMLLVLAALVIDVANWYEHGKTLQIRADAAVLAAGQEWAYPCLDSTNALIEARAREYVGSHMRHPPSGGTLVTAPYNNLITTTSPNDVHVVFNSLEYFEKGGSDWTDLADPNFATSGKPCSREYLDAKITEEDIAGFFGRFAGISFLPSLSRRARVAPFEVESIEGILPIGVKAFDVRSVAVLYVPVGSAGNVAPLDKKYLTKDPDGDGPDPDATEDFAGFVRWSHEADPTPTPCTAPPQPNCDANDASPASFAMPTTGAEAVLVLSSRSACGLQGVTSPPPCLDLTGPSVDDICNQGDTECFDKTASGSPPVQALRGGLARIAANNPTAGSTVPVITDPPAVRSVTLTPVTCRTGTFVYGDATTGCDIRLSVELSFAGGTLPTGRPDTHVRFEAHDALGWCGNGGCTLTREAVGSPIWTATIPAAAVADTAVDGRNPIRIRWRMAGGTVAGATGNCSNSNPGGGSNPCDGGFDQNGTGFVQVPPNGPYTIGSPLHQIFSSNELLSGPTEVIRTWDASTQLPRNSFERGTTVSVFADVFLSNVVATEPGDPPIALRIAGSQNGSIDCDDQEPQFSVEFATGCKPRYAANTFTTNPPCPDYNVLWTTPQPWTCVKTQTGVALGNITKALQDRVLEGGNNCVPDNDANPGNFRAGWNWWNFGLDGPDADNLPDPAPASMFPNFRPTDPRLVTLFITPFGSFQGSGNAIFPISGFGAFYITGWSVTAGNQDPCPGADPAPDKFLIGHFIKDVLISGATPSQNKCNPASLTPCVVALTE